MSGLAGCAAAWQLPGAALPGPSGDERRARRPGYVRDPLPLRQAAPEGAGRIHTEAAPASCYPDRPLCVCETSITMPRVEQAQVDGQPSADRLAGVPEPGGISPDAYLFPEGRMICHYRPMCRPKAGTPRPTCELDRGGERLRHTNAQNPQPVAHPDGSWRAASAESIPRKLVPSVAVSREEQSPEDGKPQARPTCRRV